MMKPLGSNQCFFTEPGSPGSRKPLQPTKAVTTVPFRVLDAPNMKDDYYCTILAYCHTFRTLAVALTNKVYLWTEQTGVRYPPLPPTRVSNFVTSLSFSSNEGSKAILGIASHNGDVSLWSLLESRMRFEAPHPYTASCLAFRPSVSYRSSATSPDPHVPCEDLLVGDDAGFVYYYSIEWPIHDSAARGSMALLAKLNAHTQNICGLTWCPDSRYFVTGGNDNMALLFSVSTILFENGDQDFTQNRTGLVGAERHPVLPTLHHGILTPPSSPERTTARPSMSSTSTLRHVPPTPEGPVLATPAHTPTDTEQPRMRMPPRRPTPGPDIEQLSGTLETPTPPLHSLLSAPDAPGLTNAHIRSFPHCAAVKALAFAPWQPSLLATGGGSNDRQIHFHHTGSGTTLAVIQVFAQVTSLIWSRTKREIASTFGYAQPEHGKQVLHTRGGSQHYLLCL